MNFNEHDAKKAILVPAGIPVLNGRLCHEAAEAAEAVRALGPCAIKAQVPTGKRGKAGGIKLAKTPEEAQQAAETILGMSIGGYEVGAVLAEQAATIRKEYYAAVLHAPSERASLVLFCAEGGMDIEELAEERPQAIRRFLVKDPGHFTMEDALMLTVDLDDDAQEVARILVSLYRRYRETDAELLEINPLARLDDGRVVALDCKFVLDDAASSRQETLCAHAAPAKSTALEREAAAQGLKYIELDGEVGILANGAGLTMTTMDVVSHYGGRPANFMEIGGDAYTKAEPALRVVLTNPKLRSLVVNFCGAFARTDVMAEGVVNAWKKLKPEIPVFFSVHGTGEDEAVALITAELGLTPYDLMEDAVQAAIGTAQ
ncbi:MAG: succinate--CoA ligase [Rhodospirillales bacterium]|nr:succinate--CoA ligase [Rhodospirillales bacterium]